MRRGIGWLLALLLLGGAQATEERATPITTVTVQTRDLAQVTRVQATIESVNTPLIHAKVAAEVVELLADEGDRVRKGQVLARLDDEGFRLDREAAAANIARLEATLANQRATLRRDQKLFAKGLIADTRLDASRTAVKQTRAAIVHARALLKKADYLISHTVVRAPLDGIVQQRLVSVGDYLNPMSPASKAMFRIVDTAHLRARLLLPDELAGRVRPGQRVTLYRGSDRVQTRVREVLPLVAPTSGTLEALADFEGRDGWPPGSRVTADLVLAEHRAAPALPEAALVRRPAGLVAYRLEGDDRVRAVPVRTGIRQDGWVEILSGPAPGDRVALDGAAFLADGVRVKVGDGAAQ